MYRKVPTDMKFVEREKEMLRPVEAQRASLKSASTRRDGAERFTFFDGPPTANGQPHIGHIETRAIKDLIPRFQTMKGKDVAAQGRLGYPRPARGAGGGKAAGSGRQAADRGLRHRALHRGVQKERLEIPARVGEDVRPGGLLGGYGATPTSPTRTTISSPSGGALKKICEQGPALQGPQGRALLPALRHRRFPATRSAQGYKDVKEISAIVRFKVKGDGEYLLSSPGPPRPGRCPPTWRCASTPTMTTVKHHSEGERLYILAAGAGAAVFARGAGGASPGRTMPGASLVGTAYEPLLPL